MRDAILISQMVGLVFLTLFFILVPPVLCAVLSFTMGYTAMLHGLPRWIAILFSGVLAFGFAWVWHNWLNKHVFPRIKNIANKLNE